jgi:putative transposase
LRNAGTLVNHKRLNRVYKNLWLSLRRKVKKRLPERVKQPLVIPECFTQNWSIDFMTDTLENGRNFRSFNVLDDYNREILFIEIDYSIKSSRVIYVQNHFIKRVGKPNRLRMDNGPEFVAKISQQWANMHEIIFQYLQQKEYTGWWATLPKCMDCHQFYRFTAGA